MAGIDGKSLAATAVVTLVVGVGSQLTAHAIEKKQDRPPLIGGGNNQNNGGGTMA